MTYQSVATPNPVITPPPRRFRHWLILGLTGATIATVLLWALWFKTTGQEQSPTPVEVAQAPATSPNPAEPAPTDTGSPTIDLPPPPDPKPEPTPTPPTTPPPAEPKPKPEPKPEPDPEPEPKPEQPNSQTVEPPTNPDPPISPPEIITIELPPIANLDPPGNPVDEPGPETEPSQDPDLGNRLRLTADARAQHWDHTNPQIVSASAVRQACHQIEHIVHGCYLRSGRNEQIYIVNTTCPGLTESTAVHELLHSVYSHLSSDQRQQLKGYLLDFYNARSGLVAELLAPYGQLDLETQINELHSFVGQGIDQLPTKLATHYNQYFADGRAAALDYHRQYQDLISHSRQSIDSLNQQIHQHQSQLDQQRRAINDLRRAIDDDLAWFKAQDTRLDELRSNLSDPAINAEYNRLVEDYNQRVGLYRQRTNDYNQRVGDYNQLVNLTREVVNDHNQRVERANRINRGDCRELAEA